MSINVGRQMIEFDEYEKEEFDKFIRDHVCKTKPHRAGDCAPLLCSIEIQACTISYWKSVKCELCGEKKSLTDISTL